MTRRDSPASSRPRARTAPSNASNGFKSSGAANKPSAASAGSASKSTSQREGSMTRRRGFAGAFEALLQSRDRNLPQDRLDASVGGDALELGIGVQEEPVAQHRCAEALHVVGRDVIATLARGHD